MADEGGQSRSVTAHDTKVAFGGDAFRVIHAEVAYAKTLIGLTWLMQTNPATTGTVP